MHKSWGASLVSLEHSFAHIMGLRQEEDIIQPMERMTSSGGRHQDRGVQVQV